MKKYLALLVLLCLAATASATDLESFFDRAMQEQIEAFNIPGAAISVVIDGEVVLARGYGHADVERGIPVDAGRSLFRLGSVSKILTWTAVLQLVKQGSLDLDADINTYLDFEIPLRLYKSSDIPPPITLTHLMTHTAGFEDIVEDLFRLSGGLPLHDYIRTRLPARIFPPGAIMAYSNYGTALAGYIVARVSGMPFEQYVEQHILAPLEMAHSSFQQPLPEHLSGDQVQAYRFVEGRFQKGDFEYMPAPAGGMSSTSLDMAHLMIAYLQEGRFEDRRILGTETARKMLTHRFSHHLQLGGMTLGFMGGTFNGQRVIFHTGSTTLFDSVIYLLPDQNTGIFASFCGGSHLAHTALFQAFLDRFYPVPRAEEKIAPPAGSAERAKKYAGEYHQNRRNLTSSEKILSLMMGVIRVQTDADGFLNVTHIGETNRFVETTPGIYRNLRQGRTQDGLGPFRTIVFDTDPFDRTMLMSDGPMTYSRAPWYATSSFTGALIGLSLLIILVSLLYRIIRVIIRLVQRRNIRDADPQSALRYTAIASGLLALLFIIGLLATGQPHPVYRLPLSAFGILPTWNPIHEKLPLIFSLAGIAVVALTALSWKNSLGTLRTRIHNACFSIATLGLMWVFYYWNLL